MTLLREFAIARSPAAASIMAAVSVCPVAERASAQQPSTGTERDATEPQEVVVTAERRNENLQTGPIAATVVDADQLEAKGVIQMATGPARACPGRTRPLCPYPAVARHVGSGNPEDAASCLCK
jgi:hypothetical protein